MNNNYNAPRLMMSDSISDQVEDEFFSEAEKKFVIANFIFNSKGKTFMVAGSVISYLFDSCLEIESKITTEDAFDLSRLWPSISVEEFEIHRKPDHIKVIGPYKVSALRVQEFDHDMQMCVIAMKLCKELHTYRMECYI